MGEGTILVVLFIQLQKHPRVSCATGMFINIIISGGFAAVFAVEGYFDDFYYLSFGLVTLIACLVGMTFESLIYYRVRKWALVIILSLLAIN